MFPTDAGSFRELLIGQQIYVYLGMSALNALLLFFATMKFLLVLQVEIFVLKQQFLLNQQLKQEYLIIKKLLRHTMVQTL